MRNMGGVVNLQCFAEKLLFCYCLYACRYSIVIRSRRKKRCEPIAFLQNLRLGVM
jgi:hypothetical protein